MKEQRNAGGLIESFVCAVDKGLKTLSGSFESQRENPAGDLVNEEMDEMDRGHAAGLMRVNHIGEICAQALYEGQAFSAQSEGARDSLLEAAQQELDHLKWCESRLEELESRSSILAPFFYASSFCVGALTGLAGDKHSLGFVEATEDQVVKHLDEHLEILPESDKRSRAILSQMRKDEERHRQEALALGGTEFNQSVKIAMKAVSGVMTKTTYRV